MQDYGGFSAQPTVMIRGVGADRPEYENSAQIVNDGLALGDSIMTHFPLFDIEQVEVLRGPQATLYGKNALGGIVNIISRRPENRFEANAKVGGHTHRGINFGAALSGPVVGDRMLSRLSFVYDKERGDVKDPLSGKHIDGGETAAGRLVNVFNITDTLRADLQLMASRFKDNGMEAYTFPNRSNTPVLMGKKAATRDEIEQAAKAANAHDFITALPDGYRTTLGKRPVYPAARRKDWPWRASFYATPRC